MPRRDGTCFREGDDCPAGGEEHRSEQPDPEGNPDDSLIVQNFEMLIVNIADMLETGRIVCP